MIQNWASYLVSREPLLGLYQEFPEFSAVTVHSVHLNSAGPSLYVRVDLPSFPDKVPQEWEVAGCDTFQLTAEFLAVENLALSGCVFPAQARLTAEDLPSSRALFCIEADGLRANYSAYRGFRVGRFSAYRSDAEPAGEDGLLEHYFFGPVDRRLYRAIPSPWIETFHGRL